MKRVLSLLAVALFTISNVNAQTEYWVYFTPKKHAEEYIQQGKVAIGDDALAKRFLRSIPIDAKDVAVLPENVKTLRALGVNVIGNSRWMNASVIEWDGAIDELEALPFVKKVEPVKYLQSNLAEVTGVTSLDYGTSRQQIELLHGQYLHDDGYTGQGMRIAVLDAGFANTNVMRTFDSLYVEGRVVDTYDFVNSDTNVYDAGGRHGTAVLSCMAALNPDTLTGTAPHADYAFYTTENVFSESRQEEYNWIFGAERADSIGCDIINTSLGYYAMDDPNDSYSYGDMDGNTTIITRGADAAASRGILVVASAGNEGFNSWGKIIAPCDGDSVFCIGGVGMIGEYVPFSSRGPSADGRVKPNVAAVAASAMVANGSDTPTPANGTSFSAPTMAGMAACAWQKYPSKSNWEIMKAIEFISDRYYNPDTLTGHGIPNFSRIDELLSTGDDLVQVLDFEVYPNPTNGEVKVNCESCEELDSWALINLNGVEVLQGSLDSSNRIQLDVAPGVYMLQLQSERMIGFQKIIIR